jgi:hypothetical protein
VGEGRRGRGGEEGLRGPPGAPARSATSSKVGLLIGGEERCGRAGGNTRDKDAEDSRGVRASGRPFRCGDGLACGGPAEAARRGSGRKNSGPGRPRSADPEAQAARRPWPRRLLRPRR